MDLRGAAKEYITQFIEAYRDHPALWNTATLDYRDQKKKKAGYEALMKVTSAYYDNISLPDVKKRINSLRTCYRRERIKIWSWKSKTGENYTPNLWYYELLSFLGDVVSSPAFNYLEVSVDGSTDEDTDDKVDFHKIYLADPENDSNDGTTSPPPSLKPKQRKRSSKNLFEEKSLKNTHIDCDDEFDIMGKGFAIKLRRISKISMVRVGIAEKLINDVLFQTEFVDISRDAHIVNEPRHPTKGECNST